MNRWTRWLSTLVVAVVVATGLSLSSPHAQGLRPHEPFNPAKAQVLADTLLTIDSGGKTYPFVVEVAVTEAQRDTGLMHRNFLAANRGMLFNSSGEERQAFWMRNTFIPLDMLFIHANGKIEFIAENTRPHSEYPIGPKIPVQAVLELPGGTSKRLGIKPGDVVHHAAFHNETH